MEYIERDALLAKQQMDADFFKGSTLRTDIARRDEALNAVANIVNAPTADVAPVRRGKWKTVMCDDGYGEYTLFECDQCGSQSAQKRNYCSNCGAKME